MAAVTVAPSSQLVVLSPQEEDAVGYGGGDSTGTDATTARATADSGTTATTTTATAADPPVGAALTAPPGAATALPPPRNKPPTSKPGRCAAALSAAVPKPVARFFQSPLWWRPLVPDTIGGELVSVPGVRFLKLFTIALLWFCLTHAIATLPFVEHDENYSLSVFFNDELHTFVFYQVALLFFCGGVYLRDGVDCPAFIAWMALGAQAFVPVMELKVRCVVCGVVCSVHSVVCGT